MKPLRIGIVAESTGLPLRSAIAEAAKMGAEGLQADAVGDLWALKTALSYYNTGHPVRGLNNGYVGKVETAAERIVPAIRGASPTDLDPTPAAPPEVPSAAWDVFGEVRRGHGSFVTTVSITASGGFQ